MRNLPIAALACLLLAASSASAQTPREKLKIEVTRAELQLVGQGLMELPYKTSAALLSELQAQLIAIDQAAIAAKAKAAGTAQDKSPLDKPAE